MPTPKGKPTPKKAQPKRAAKGRASKSIPSVHSIRKAQAVADAKSRLRASHKARQALKERGHFCPWKEVDGELTCKEGGSRSWRDPTCRHAGPRKECSFSRKWDVSDHQKQREVMGEYRNWYKSVLNPPPGGPKNWRPRQQVTMNVRMGDAENEANRKRNIQDPLSNPMSKNFPNVVKGHAAGMVNRIINATMPFMECELSKDRYTRGQETWPGSKFVCPRACVTCCHRATLGTSAPLPSTMPHCPPRRPRRTRNRSLTPVRTWSTGRRGTSWTTVPCGHGYFAFWIFVTTPSWMFHECSEPWRRAQVAVPPQRLPVYGPDRPGRGPPPAPTLLAHPGRQGCNRPLVPAHVQHCPDGPATGSAASQGTSLCAKSSVSSRGQQAVRPINGTRGHRCFRQP